MHREGFSRRSNGLREVLSVETRKHRIAHRQVVDKRSDYERLLLDVGFYDAVIGVEVGVPGHGLIVSWILQETDGRQARARG